MKNRFSLLSVLPFSFFMVSAFGYKGLTIPLGSFVALLCLFILSQFLLILQCSDKKNIQRIITSPKWLCFMFFLSGMAAIIYQIAWQRSLFQFLE